MMSIFDQVGPPPDGFVYFFGRESFRERHINEKEELFIKEIRDVERMNDLKQKGWKVVPSERYPELSEYHSDGAIRSGGLILLERPKEMDIAENKKYEVDPLKLIIETIDGTGLTYHDESEIPMYGPLSSIKRQGGIGLNEQGIEAVKERKRREKEEKLYIKCPWWGRMVARYKRLNIKFFLWLEGLKLKMRLGEYNLDEEEQEVCNMLEISKFAYMKEKYKAEVEKIECKYRFKGWIDF